MVHTEVVCTVKEIKIGKEEYGRKGITYLGEVMP